MLLAWILACGADGRAPSPGPAGPPPALDLGSSSGAVAWQAMDALTQARIALPAVDPGDVSPGVFSVADGWEAERALVGRMRVWTRPLPFVCDMPRPNYAPLGARLLRGAREIPFAAGRDDLVPGVGGWYVEDGQMRVVAMESPESWADAPVLEAPELIASQARRHWDPAAGVAPVDYLYASVTLASVTRPALQLPVGGEVSWELAVPPAARLCFGVALLPDVVPHADDHAEAVWSAGGTELGRRRVRADTPHEEVCAEVEEGPRTLSFRAEAGAGGRGHVVFTAPLLRVPPTREVRRVVVVGIDTLRWDTLGIHGYARDTSPELDAFARQSVVFDHAYAPAPRTRPSFRTALTGRYPYAAIHAPTLAEHLRPLGFRTAGIVANVHLVPRFGFNAGFEHWYYQNGALAGDQVDRALAWLRSHRDEDSLLFLHIMDPHTWYNAPEPFASRFQAGSRPKPLPELFDRWAVYKVMKRKSFGDAHRAWIRGAYDGEVAYMSRELGRLFAGLDALPGDTLTVVHSDHGEEFWDHGAFEHNHTLYDELVRAVLWIRPPGGWSAGPHRIAAPASLADLVPTVLDLVGAAPAESDGTSLRGLFDPGGTPDAVTATLEARPLPIGHLMFGKERWAVVHQGFKYVLHTVSGQEELYDLHADPGEKSDLADGEAARLATMRAAMETAFGWPVRAGWRLRIVKRGAPFELRFDAPVQAAGILDPEADRVQRSNLEWGESPEVPVEDVGTVRLAEDRRSLRFVPGPRAPGEWLYVACEAACPAATLHADGASTDLVAGEIQAGSVSLRVKPGTLMLPAVTEAQALAGSVESGQMEALKQLGYVDGD